MSATSVATHEDSDSPITYSDSGSISPQVFTPPVPLPYATPTKVSAPSYDVTEMGENSTLEPKYALLVQREQMPLPPNEHPSTSGPSTFVGSNTHLARDFDHPALPPLTSDASLLPPAGRGHHQPPLPGGGEGESARKAPPLKKSDSEALSAAVSDLMKRSAFVGAVTLEYHWPGEGFSVKVSNIENCAMKC